MKKSGSEHALAIIKAGLSAVPFVGGSIASLIGDYIPTATQATIDAAIKQLAQRLQLLEKRLDPENVNADEFSEIFKTAYLTIVRTHRNEKVQAAVSLIANTLLKDGDKDKLTFTEADHFARSLEQLSIGAIQVLSTAGQIARKAYNGDLHRALHGDHNQARRFNFGILQDQLPDYHPSLLMGLVGELDSLNLLHKAGTPAIKTRNYSNYPIELTILGVRFLISLMDEKSQSESQ